MWGGWVTVGGITFFSTVLTVFWDLVYVCLVSVLSWSLSRDLSPVFALPVVVWTCRSASQCSPPCFFLDGQAYVGVLIWASSSPVHKRINTTINPCGKSINWYTRTPTIGLRHRRAQGACKLLMCGYTCVQLFYTALFRATGAPNRQM